MKVCEVCGDEIYTKDGDNRCSKIRCQNVSDAPKKRKRRPSQRDAVLRSLGLVKVKGALGGTFWE